MSLAKQFLSIVTLILVLLMKIEGNSTSSIPNEVNKNSSSTMLEEIRVDQIYPGCSTTPGICGQGEFPPRTMCCGNRCVDVTTDRDNCGLCGFRCLFNFQCCNRFCVNINLSPLNCGACGRACPFGSLCLFGRCAFEIPAPPPSPSMLPKQKPPN